MSILKFVAARCALSILFGVALSSLAAAQTAGARATAQPANAAASAAEPIAPDELFTDDDSPDGEPSPGATFGPGPWLERLTGELGLTADQQTQAKAIFEQARNEIKVLHDQAHEQIRALLTAQQRATFDSLPKPPMADHGPGMRGRGGPRMLDRLTERLGLTPDQVASVKTIHDKLMSAVRARHDAAKTQLDALLSPDQLNKLNTLKAEHPLGRGPMRGQGMLQRLGQKLGLTAEQRTQAQTIFQQTHAGMKALHEQARQQVSALLTADQQAKLDSVWPQGAAGEPRMGGRHGEGGAKFGGPRGGRHGKFADRPAPGEREHALLDRLQNGLVLTADQLTSVQAILGTLHSSASALRATGRQQFRALLTPEQTTILDQMKAQHDPASDATAG